MIQFLEKGIFMKKKIYKALSILLTLVIVFSACLCVFNTVSAATEEKTYYVASSGNDSRDGSKKLRAVKTLNRIIELANAEGLGEGDIVTALVLGTTDVSWRADTSDKLTAHDFKLIVQSENKDGSAIIGAGKQIHMGGDTDFKNIGINFGSSWKYIFANGHNVTFGQGTRYLGNTSQSGFYGGGNDSGVLKVTNTPYTIISEMPINAFNISNHFSSITHNADINIVYNAGTGTPVFAYGNGDNNGSVTYNAALNIVVKAAASVTFSDNKNNAVFGQDGYMQIINHTATEVTAAEGTDLARVPSGKLWVLNNKLQANSLFELTDTKGKFKVSADFENVKATSVTDSSVVINAENGYLTLPAGVYNITASKIPVEKTYYVEEDGTGDGTSEDTPIGSIAAAITKALSDGLIVGDIVNIKLIGDEVPQGEYPNYAFTLNIAGNDPAVQTRIPAEYAIANNTTAWTNYDNVELYKASENQALYLQNGNVNISSTVKYTHTKCALVFGDTRTGKTVPGQKLIYNATTEPTTITSIRLSNWSYANLTYSGVVDLECNVPATTARIGFNAYYNSAPSGKTVFKEAVNVNIKSANNAEFINIGGATFEKGLQVINSSALPTEKTGELTNVPADKLYFINNVSGNGNLLEFTDTIGTYKVNLDNPEHDVVAKNVDTQQEYTFDKTGTTITLPAGFYEVRIERDPIYMDYYVSNDGITIASGERPATAGTKENPVKTYADATRLIAQDGLTPIDVATIYIPSGNTVYWGTEPANFACQAIITSTIDGNPGTLQTSDKGSNNAELTGNAIFRNVKFTVAHQYDAFIICDYNLTIEKDAEFVAPRVHLWKTGHGVVHTKDVDIRIEGYFKSNSLGFNAHYHNHTSTGNYNIYLDNAESTLPLKFGGNDQATGPNIYNGNINIIVKNAKTISFDISQMGATFNGALQMIVDGNVTLPYGVYKNFSDLEVAGGKWYITNAASDDDFISFSANKGVFDIKGGAKAYSRQLNADNVEHTGGVVDFSSAPGAYTISDKEIAPLTDDSHKMLYFSLSGNGQHIGTRARVVPGETYIFEYSIYTSLYSDSRPTLRKDGGREEMGDTVIISEKKVGDYYEIVAEVTVPENYDPDTKNESIDGTEVAFFVVNLAPYSEGVMFDRTVYKKGDETKTDLFEGNQKFYDGLDRVTANFEFWGGVFTDDRGGKGLTYWTNGSLILEIMNYDAEFIKHLIKLQNPNDGEWWEKDDILEEDKFATFAKAKGTFKDQNGKPVVGAKMLLVSDAKSYTARTNASGNFNFGKIMTGYYDLYVVNGTTKIPTGFSGYIAQDDVVTFNVVTDTSALGGELSGDSTETDISEGATSSFTGTVYTPQLDTIEGLKIVLKGVGEVVTDEKGAFGFANVPIGTYELYAINEDGSEYFFREIEIEEGVTRSVKLKYDAPVNSGNVNTGWVIYIIIAAIVALLAVGGLVVFLVLRKKKAE